MDVKRIQAVPTVTKPQFFFSFQAYLTLRLACYEKLCSISHRKEAQVGRLQIRSSGELSAKVNETPG